jgi:DNA-3-methyladenine glycosylase
MSSLTREFFDRPVLEVAGDLIGCTLVHGAAAGIIVETEAYHEREPACHAFIGVTPRTSVLFGRPGIAYVYRSYGIHALFNAVCETSGVGAAVLIRALEPIADLEAMRGRRGGARDGDLCSGPGKLTQALAISLEHNRQDLLSGTVRIGPRPPSRERPEVRVGPRVGITKATDLPWRFWAEGNPHVSRPRLRAAPTRAIRPAASPPTKGARTK